MTTLQVGVIVPTHNSAAFLGRTLASISGQERRPDEVILVDDESTDDTVAVSREWAAGQPFSVQLIKRAIPHDRLAGPGPAAGRTTALRQSKADLLALLDHDDEFFPSHLRLTSEVLERNADLSLCFGDAVERLADGSERRFVSDTAAVLSLPYEERAGGLRAMSGSFVPAMIQGSRIATAANLWRRDMALEIGGFDPRVGTCDDWLFFLSLSRRGRVGYLPTPIARKHTHEANLSHPRHALRLGWNFFDALSEFMKTPDTWQLEPAELDALRRRRVELVANVCYAASKQGVRTLRDTRARLPAPLSPSLRDWLRAIHSTWSTSAHERQQ